MICIKTLYILLIQFRIEYMKIDKTLVQDIQRQILFQPAIAMILWNNNNNNKKEKERSYEAS